MCRRCSGRSVPSSEKLHVRAVQDGVLITGTGGRLPAGSAIVTVCDGHAAEAVLVTHRQRDGVGAGAGVGPWSGTGPGARAVAEVPRVGQRRGVLVGRGAAVEGAHVLRAAVGEVGDRRQAGRRCRSRYTSLARHRRDEAVLVDATDEDGVARRSGSPAWCTRSSSRASRGCSGTPSRQLTLVLVNVPGRAHVLAQRRCGSPPAPAAICWSSSTRPLTKIRPSVKTVPVGGCEQVLGRRSAAVSPG